MKARPVVATLFVVCCLLLCGLILRRQIAAHPLPPDAVQRPGQGSGYPMSAEWQPASPQGAAEVRTVLQEYLTAVRDNNAVQAAASRSFWLRQMFHSPAMFLQAVKQRYPDLNAWHHLAFGPVGTDSSGQFARALVILDKNDGTHLRVMVLLVREGKQFKVDRLRTEPAP